MPTPSLCIQSESYDTLLGFNMVTYRSSKNLWKSCVEHHTFFRLYSPHVRGRRFPLSLGSKFTYSGRTEFQTVEEGRQRARLERTFIRSPSRRLGSTVAPPVEEKAKLVSPPARPPRPYDNKVTSLGSREPRRAWGEDGPPHPSDDEGGFPERGEELPPFSPALPTRGLSYVDDEVGSERTGSAADYDMGPYGDHPVQAS
ncbi:unnamed protein product [Timema podura]|uniref:FERM adjacent domain-containing protein n=1 Tax=Timema podura TaxID=61482 RepID=A0ABN7PDP8_TIMPD|nr:unnamed protein product [Timema podura]